VRIPLILKRIYSNNTFRRREEALAQAQLDACPPPAPLQQPPKHRISKKSPQNKTLNPEEHSPSRPPVAHFKSKKEAVQAGAPSNNSATALFAHDAFASSPNNSAAAAAVSRFSNLGDWAQQVTGARAMAGLVCALGIQFNMFAVCFEPVCL
jgi:hypothetical protein